MVDLNEMVVFTKVVEARTFSGAARQLGLPKSTVSRKITQLEERLGVRLLQRTTRSVTLTELGAAYYERCSRIVAEAEEAELAISQCQENPRGVLRVSAPAEMGSAIGQWVAEYLIRYPDVRIELDLSSRYVDLVEEGYDLAIRAGTLTDSSLVARRLGRSHLVVCAAPGYLQENGTPQSPQDLKGHPCLLFGQQGRRQTLQFSGAANNVSVSISGRLVVNNMEVVRAAALEGVGVAVLPNTLCRDAVAEGRLIPLLDGWHMAEGGVYAVYPSPRHLTPKVRSFIDFVGERFDV